MIKKQQGPQGNPEYINILSIEDKELYEQIQKNVSSQNFRYKRNRQIETLTDVLNCIRKYCEKDEEGKWKRYLVCGICWFDDYIAINTRQLQLLISKSKSAINWSLSKMGYITVKIKNNSATKLIKTIPYLSSSSKELRKWSLRKKNPLPDEIATPKVRKRKNKKKKKKKKRLNFALMMMKMTIFMMFYLKICQVKIKGDI